MSDHCSPVCPSSPRGGRPRPCTSRRSSALALPLALPPARWPRQMRPVDRGPPTRRSRTCGQWCSRTSRRGGWGCWLNVRSPAGRDACVRINQGSTLTVDEFFSPPSGATTSEPTIAPTTSPTPTPFPGRAHRTELPTYLHLQGGPGSDRSVAFASAHRK